jgi:1,2-diacylglycerol 3-beta-galactosyltransferase
VICKAGGLIVTESLACGMPLLLIDVIPGQEEGNRDFVLKYGAGVMVENPMQTIETLSHWLADDGRVLKEYAKSACSVGRSNSAFDAVDLIWQAAQRGPRNSRGKPGTRRTSLIDLLTRNNIPLGDTQKRKAKELS